MEITRYTSLSEQQFLGCTTAFVDSLHGELNSAIMFLRKLEGQPKGAAFAFEMALDRHRYGALTVIDRWAQLVHTFGPHLRLSARQSIVDEAAGRVQTAENLLGRTNQLLDASEQYSSDLVNACALAFQSLNATFSEEREAADQAGKLGPMLPEEFHTARRVFAQDLARR